MEAKGAKKYMLFVCASVSRANAPRLTLSPPISHLGQHAVSPYSGAIPIKEKKEENFSSNSYPVNNSLDYLLHSIPLSMLLIC